MPPKIQFLKISIVLTLAILGSFGCADIALAQKVDQTALIAQLQKQIQQLLSQIQTLQKEVTELKTETGIQTPPISPLSPLTPFSETKEVELPEFTRSLSLGTRGDDVRKLQEFLARDKEIYPEGLATGFFGPKTVEAVKRWQKKNKLDAVGIVGSKTIAKFKELGQGVIQGLIQQGTPSGMVPPGLMMAPGIQRQMATTTPPMPYATTTPPVSMLATTTPAIPAEPATPAIPGATSAIPAIPATPAQPASSTSSNELKVTYPNGGETWYKGNAYTITWQNPLAGGFTNKEKYYWNVILKRGNTAWQADGGVPVTQSSYTWSKWTGWAEPIPNANDFKVGISLVDTCAAQVDGSCPSANISIIPSGGIDYSDGYFTATTTPTTITTTDTTPPMISSVSTMDPAANSATIIWFTNEVSDSQVEYGLTTSYGNSTTVNTTLKTEHSRGLTGLTPASTYHYRVKSKDGAGNLAISNDYTFITLAASGGSSTDTTAPTVNSLAVGYPNLTAQTQPVYIGFNANEEVKVIYEYGLTTSYGSSLNVWDQYWTGNGIYLPTLSSGTTYHVRAKATDRAGNVGYSQDYTFTTASPNTPPVITSGPNHTSTDATPKEAIMIEFATSLACDSSFQYGLSTAYGTSKTPGNPTNKTSHYFFLTGLATNSTYYYKINCVGTGGTLEKTGSYTTGDTSTTSTPPTTASTYYQMKDQLKAMEIILRGLLGR
ncbi:MAG: peptidoglycan-binding protein [bacterium]|nr:peptidoglycan-binding protein [bacterium]